MNRPLNFHVAIFCNNATGIKSDSWVIKGKTKEKNALSSA